MYWILVVFLGYFFARILFRIRHSIHDAKLTPVKSGEPKIDSNAGDTRTRDGGAVESHELTPDLSGGPKIDGNAGDTRTQETTMQAEIVTAKDTRLQYHVSVSALMAREIGICPRKNKINMNQSVVPPNLTESITKSSGLVIVTPPSNTSFLERLAALDDNAKIRFDDLKNSLTLHEKKRESDWHSLPNQVKTIELYRSLVGYSYDVSNLVSIFKEKMKKGGQCCTKKDLLEGIRLWSGKRANPADGDQHYVERLTAKLAQCVPLFQPKKVQ
jgi:hypothetical protein